MSIHIPPSVEDPLESPIQTNSVQERRQLKQRRVTKLFIESAQHLIQEDGIKHLSIRKLSQVTGYSSATLYSYFSDLEELILYASIKYRKDYLQDLSREITPEMNELEQYRKIYEIFNTYSFAEPEVFYNMYFGRHSDAIDQIFDSYYDLYPEEMPTQATPLIQEMLGKRRLLECDMVLTRRLANAGFIRPENAGIVAEIVVRLQQTFLMELLIKPSLNRNQLSQKFLSLFDHIMATN